jgi:hypothetical protein
MPKNYSSGTTCSLAFLSYIPAKVLIVKQIQGIMFISHVKIFKIYDIKFI